MVYLHPVLEPDNLGPKYGKQLNEIIFYRKIFGFDSPRFPPCHADEHDLVPQLVLVVEVGRLGDAGALEI